MSKNLDQVYIANPSTSNASTDLMYFMQSPYTAGTDSAMTYANFAAQFGAPYTAAALTKTDDTNVTLTLGGTPSTALLHAASLTLGWTGTLSLARGGTNANLTPINGGIVWSNATQLQIISAGSGIINRFLLSGGIGAPVWSQNVLNDTVQFPANSLVYASLLGNISSLATANSSVLTTSSGGVPTWAATLPVGNGGTGLAAITAHNLIIGNGTSAATLLAPSATSGVPLISQGASSDPVYGTALVAGGGTGVTSITTAPAATSWAGWDANKNLSANSFIEGYRTTATAAGTTTLVVGDAEQQFFTGSTTQTVVMPVTSTLVAGQIYRIVNLSTGVVTVQSSGANSIQAMAANSVLILTVINTGVTTAAGWSAVYQTLAAAVSAVSVGSTGTNSAYGGDGSANGFTLGNYSFSYGDSSTRATGLNSFAFGHNTLASDQFAVAMGTGVSASSRYCFAFGNGSTASNFYSFAFGNSATASNSGTFAFGSNSVGAATASGQDSVAFGSGCWAKSSFGWALGKGATSNSAGSVVWFDNTASGTQDTGTNQFVLNFANGYYMYKGDFRVSTVGFGLQVKEGSNAKQGVATLSSGTVVVSNTSVTANSRIFLTAQDGNTVGALGVSARTASTSFTILSSVLTDSGVVAYQIFEPA